MRGPLVYCLEAVDNPGLDVRDVILPAGAEIVTGRRPELLGGVTTLSFDGLVAPVGGAWDGTLYREDVDGALASGGGMRVTAVPYYAWANRQAGAIRVWMASK